MVRLVVPVRLTSDSSNINGKDNMYPTQSLFELLSFHIHSNHCGLGGGYYYYSYFSSIQISVDSTIDETIVLLFHRWINHHDLFMAEQISVGLTMDAIIIISAPFETFEFDNRSNYYILFVHSWANLCGLDDECYHYYFRRADNGLTPWHTPLKYMTLSMKSVDIWIVINFYQDY